MKTIEIPVEGMMCQGCVAACKMALEDVAGVSSVAVSLEEKKAVVEYDESRASREILAKAVEEAGFKVG